MRHLHQFIGSQNLLQLFCVEAIDAGLANHNDWNTTRSEALKFLESALISFHIKFHETHFMLLQECLGLPAIWALAGCIKSNFCLLFHRVDKGIG